MGIPLFFKYIFIEYPSTIDQINDKINTINIDNYFIDLNALIHNITQKFFPKEENKYENKRLLHHTKKTFKVSNQMIYSELCKEIEKRTAIIQPKKRIYIAIDGVAGLSKASQQRQRRFLSAKNKTEEEIKNFDSNCISAGTEFM